MLDTRTKITQAGYRYWLDCAGQKQMPSRADIDPMRIPRLLPNVVLIEVRHAPLDFIERVVGETVLRHSNRNSTGIPWREFPGRGPDSEIWAHYEKVAQSGRPLVERVPYVGPHRDFLRVELLSCPLSKDDSTVDRILSFVDYISLSEREG